MTILCYLIGIALRSSPGSEINSMISQWDRPWCTYCRCYPLFRRRQWHPTPVLLPGKSHGWRSLVGCSPWGCLESDTTERLHFHFSLSRIGEGNGNPLQCSCLENPRDGGAWWVAVSGVTQSRTRLKQLSSSSSSLYFNHSWHGSSLVAHWLGLGAFTALDLGSIPGWGAKISQTM